MFEKLFKSNKKPTLTAREQLMLCLSDDAMNQSEITKYFLAASEEIVGGLTSLDDMDLEKRKFHEAVVLSKHGRSWFQLAFFSFMDHLKTRNVLDHELGRLDAYLSLYWFYCNQYPNASLMMQKQFEKDADLRLRRYYDSKFNVDVFTGTILDEEKERNNAWKQHFYRASFAFRDGKGNLEVSMKEWRTFLSEFHETLMSRPRVVYDFAKEIVEHQKLFYFFSYVVKVEKLNHRKNVFETNSIDKLMRKVINAVYAVDEEHGMLLRRLYV